MKTNKEQVEHQHLEQRALKFSIGGALGMALLGLVFAALTGSEAVLLDGLFSLIGFAVGIFSLKVARWVTMPDDHQFQLGYANFEPFVNVMKGLIMGFLCVYALYSAVNSLFHGGRPISSGYALAYAVIAAIGCFLIAYAQRRAAKTTNSPLVEVEAKSWLLDGFMSSAVCIAFVVLVLIEKTSWSVYTPYADPVIVILLVLVASPIPVMIIRRNLRELLLGAPEPEVQEQVRAKIKAETKDLPIESIVLRMVKVGRSAYLNAYLVVSDSHKGAILEDLDEVRERIATEIGRIKPPMNVDVIFTLEAKWAEPFNESLKLT